MLSSCDIIAIKLLGARGSAKNPLLFRLLVCQPVAAAMTATLPTLRLRPSGASSRPFMPSAVLLLATLLAFSAQQAIATHFRYGTTSWRKVGTSQVRHH